MPAYWWSCIKCGKKETFQNACDCNGIHGFIWHQLLPSDWDQRLLRKRCAKCRANSLRITYEFPRAKKELVFVNHIVGLGLDGWIPMMWETVFSGTRSNRLYDFKYVGRKNIWGLNKPAVFTEDTLREIFELYRKKSGRSFRP
jgi:hypothetical protein